MIPDLNLLRLLEVVDEEFPMLEYLHVAIRIRAWYFQKYFKHQIYAISY